MVRILFHVGWEPMESLGREGVCNEKHHPGCYVDNGLSGDKRRSKKNKVLYYCRLQYDDGGSAGDGNSNVCLCISIFSL